MRERAFVSIHEFSMISSIQPFPMNNQMPIWISWEKDRSDDQMQFSFQHHISRDGPLVEETMWALKISFPHTFTLNIFSSNEDKQFLDFYL